MADSQNLNLFPSNTPFTSNTFSLIEDLGVIHIDGWTEGDSVCVEIKVGTECNPKWISYGPGCCGQQCICYPQSQLFISVPGQYRFVFSNKDDQHLTDPEWFDNLTVVGEKVSSNLDLTYLLEGCSDMACGLTREEVKEIVEACLAANPDIHVANVIPTGNGVFTVIMNDGSTIPFEITTGDGIVINGNEISVDINDVVNSIVNDPASVAALQAAIDTDTFSNMVDNGDGTATMTNADGTIVNVATADTFATVAGQAITFASGATLTVPVGSTLVGTVLTTSDGTVLDISTIDTDTFATLAGTTLTMADGSAFDIASIDTDTFSTLAGTVITMADGTVFDLASVDTDTDTFATLSGQTVTFANGDTINVPTGSTVVGNILTTSDGVVLDLSSFDTDTFSDIKQATVAGTDVAGNAYVVGDWIIEDKDGQVAVVSTGGSTPVAPTDADITNLVDAGTGTINGLWDKSLTVAASVAEVTDTNASKIALPISAQRQILTNRAASGDLLDGVMNANGTIGNATYYKVNTNLLATTLAEYNDIFVGTAQIIDGGTEALPDGVYNGQKLTLRWNGINSQMTVTGNFQGILRRTTDNSIDSGNQTSVEVRGSEIWKCVWIVNRWHILASFDMFSGTGYNEQTDGTYTAFGSVGASPTDIINTISLPFACSNTLVGATSAFPKISHANVSGSTAVVGAVSSPALYSLRFTSVGSANEIGFSTTAANNVGAFHYTITGLVRA